MQTRWLQYFYFCLNTSSSHGKNEVSRKSPEHLGATVSAAHLKVSLPRSTISFASLSVPSVFFRCASAPHRFASSNEQRRHWIVLTVVSTIYWSHMNQSPTDNTTSTSSGSYMSAERPPNIALYRHTGRCRLRGRIKSGFTTSRKTVRLWTRLWLKLLDLLKTDVAGENVLHFCCQRA